MPAAGKLRLDKGGRQRDDLVLYSDACARNASYCDRVDADGVARSHLEVARQPQISWVATPPPRLRWRHHPGGELSPAVSRTAKIQIAPIIGSPENVARDLQTALSSAIGRERRYRRDVRQRDKRIHAPRLYRRGARAYEGQNLLHLGCDGPDRQTRPSHHRRGSRRGRRQGSVGCGHTNSRSKHRRQDGEADRELASW